MCISGSFPATLLLTTITTVLLSFLVVHLPSIAYFFGLRPPQQASKLPGQRCRGMVIGWHNFGNFNIYWIEIRLESVSEWHNSTISKTASEEISPCRFSKNYGNLITTIGKYNLRSPIHNLCHPAHRSQSSHWPLQSCWPIPPLPSTLGAMKMRDSRKYIVWIDWLMIFPNTSNLIRTPWHFKIKI